MSSSDLKLTFSRPAPAFTEACPVGNGRMGGLLFGGIAQERIILNEEMMWSGSPQEADRPDASSRLPEIRALIFEGRHAEAQQMVNETFTCAGVGSALAAGKDAPFGCYQKFGELLIDFDHLGPVSEYDRELDLSAATVSVRTRHGDATITRRLFVSAPDQVLIYRIESSVPVSFKATLVRDERATVSATASEILLQGSLSDGCGGDGVHFAGALAASTEGGFVSVEAQHLHIRNSTVATLFLTMATALDARSSLDEAISGLESSRQKLYKTLQNRHLADFQSRFSRVSLDLPALGDTESTPARLQRLAAGHGDPSLYRLYFQYGRYLLLSSSRSDSRLPANLQGIWAEELQTPWNGDFHLNINLQMNYWPAEVANLAECHDPLIALTEKLVPNGAKTAHAYYGASGWVAHMMTTPWLFTSPGEDAHWGTSNTGGAWLCQHLWSRYAYGQDITYLRRIYPVMKGAAQFFLDFLVEDPATGRLVTCPSSSPENSFRNTHGEIASVCAGPTIDSAILRELFNNVARAADLLEFDEVFTERLRAAIARLPEYRIGRHGQLQEWLEDYEETEPEHRHFSHLYGLYPAGEISPRLTPEIAESARISLIRRGESSTGWSTAWKACCWARLGDGSRAESFLRKLLSPAGGNSPEDKSGSFPNLFCAHPPFQIDGNFGGTAAIAEMLLQSHEEHTQGGVSSYVIALLPALPPDWDVGSVSGLKARGNVEVSIRWRDLSLTTCCLTTPLARRVFLRHGETFQPCDLLPGANNFQWSPTGGFFSV